MTHEEIVHDTIMIDMDLLMDPHIYARQCQRCRSHTLTINACGGCLTCETCGHVQTMQRAAK